MSRKNTFQAHCTCSPTRIHTTTFLPYLQDHVDPLHDPSLDTDLDQRSASSVTLLSRRVSSLSTNQFLTGDNDTSSEFASSARLSESRHSHFLYPLHEPGQRIAQRTQRLRARTAAIIMSLPATCEDEDEPCKPARAQQSKLRRVSGLRDLRRTFRDGDNAPELSVYIPPPEVPKASYELGIIAAPTSPSSPLSPRSSLRTLVDIGNALPHSSGDVKTLCNSKCSSLSLSSRFSTRLYSTFSPSQTSQTCHSIHTSLSIRYPLHNLSITRTRRHTSLHLDARLSRSPVEGTWSCAKISQSAVKRAARRGHTPRRVFSNPIGALSP